ncbi:hypothetical protein TREES_T100007525 [Tupaia chinensis]|uniref:Uncharacterized protein n=1 Tax=Tupaia chinensis TaxID=246437 RepID=L9KYW3_TUPCH|nr:hypothetical protein TREES_T100007525 [Tupaia chinensis]
MSTEGGPSPPFLREITMVNGGSEIATDAEQKRPHMDICTTTGRKQGMGEQDTSIGQPSGPFQYPNMSLYSIWGPEAAEDFRLECPNGCLIGCDVLIHRLMLSTNENQKVNSNSYSLLGILHSA